MGLGQESDLELLTSMLPSPCPNQAELLLWPGDPVDCIQGEVAFGHPSPAKSEVSVKGLILGQPVPE